MSFPICFDSKVMDWKPCQPGKFVNAAIKVLYDKDCGMPERVYYLRIRPGGRIETHTHPSTEMFFVISGQGVVKAGDQEFDNITEQVFFMRPGVEHSLVNTGQDDVVLISFAVHQAEGQQAAKAAPSERELLDSVRDALQAIGGADPQAVTMSTKMRDLGFDSLVVLEVAELLGGKHAAAVSQEDARQWETIADVVAYLQHKAPVS